MIIVAILLPPLAVLLCGKPIQSLINIPLTLLFWLPGMIHAIIVVNNHNADKRQKSLIAAQNAASAAQTAALAANQPHPASPASPSAF